MISVLRRPLRSTGPALQTWLRAASSTTRETRKNGGYLTEIDSRIAPGSDNHHDLPSFLAYAERVNLSRKASVYVGTHYEYTVATTLTRLGFKLTRTGRARDYGIDLLGSWTLPIPAPWSTDPPSSATGIPAASSTTDSAAIFQGPTRPLRVLIQCKCSNKKLGPDKVRELEGAFTGAPTEWRQEDFLGLLATTNSATKGITEALQRSRWPMGFLKIDHDGRIEQFLWNRSAQARGLEGLGVTIRYLLPPIAESKVSEAEDKKQGVTEKGESETAWTDVGLTWDGWPLPYLKSEEVAALEGLNMEEVDLVEEVAEAKAGQAGLEPMVKKTRGRRKKSDIDEDMDFEGGEPKTPARRGRKKREPQVGNIPAADVELVKEDQEQVENVEDEESAPVPPVKKRGRGRPRKTPE